MTFKRLAFTSFIFCLAAGAAAMIRPAYAQTDNFTSRFDKKDFTVSESPQAKLTPLVTTSRGFFGLFKRTNPPLDIAQKVKFSLKTPDGAETTDSSLFRLQKNSDNTYSVDIDPARLTPGRYQLTMTDTTTNQSVTQDFTWGVLALNPDKSPYGIGDTAFLAMAVLNDLGEMVCNAALNLVITNPDGSAATLSTQNNLISVNPVCHTKDVTLIPDYQAVYPIGSTGTYNYTLTANTSNGSYSINGSFTAKTNSDFVIKRLAATRIYPPNAYPVKLEITANQNFIGTITESVPSSFVITKTAAKISLKGNRKILTWPVNLKKGIKTTLSYSYNAPLISPEYYLLGPLQFNQGNKLIFTESRTWQIASDATATLTPANSNWVVPANVFSLKVEAWGAGGIGGPAGAAGTYGGGGGGGAYSNLLNYTSFSPGDTLTVSIGAGGATAGANGGNTYFINTSTLLAIGGSGTNSNVGASGGTTAAGVGNTKFAGGKGAGPGTYAGGGGGGAGDSGDGGAASTNTGGTGGAGVGYSGGAGANGRTAKGDGQPGSAPGGGGSGGFGGTGGAKVGGAGADGQIIITYTVNQAPNIPTNSTPGNGTTAVALTPTLTASTFSDPDSGDTFSASQWQIASDNGFTSVVWDTGTTGAASNSVNVGYTLSNNTVYYWHVQYKDNRNNWSTYSVGTSFTTVGAANSPPTAPTALLVEGQSSPVLGIVDTTPEFSATYNDPDGSDQADKYWLEVDDDSGFGSILWDSGSSGTAMSACNQGTNCADISYAGTALTRGTTYYWRIKFWDLAGETSPWSAGTPSFSINSIPNTPTLISPANGAVGVTTTPKLTLVTTDADSNSLQYQIFLATDVNFTGTTQTFNVNSSQVGWSGINVGTSAFSSGTTAAYTIQSALNYSTLYYWKAQAIDPPGTNIWSSLSVGSSFTTMSAPNQSPTAPTALLVEGQASPVLGIVDTTPEFSATYNDPDSSDQANKYWLQVDDDSGFGSILWDSGGSGTAMSACNQGTNCADISYAGTALTRGTTYYWRIKFWDLAGETSPWSVGTPSFSINSIPNTPTLISPANGAVGVTTTPKLTLVTTDADTNNLQYQIFLATDAAFTGTTQTFNVNSSQVGWSGINVGTSAFSSGTTAAYTIQSALNYSTLYYWKAQAIDPPGSNLWSSLSVGSSFTTMSAPNQAPTAPTALLVEGQSSPVLGIVDTTPEFSATYNDPDGSDQADKYWLEVDDDSGFGSILWDTGSGGTAMSACNQGTNCADISYAGTALTRGTTYYWRIKFWDLAGETSPWSVGTPSFSINSLASIPVLTYPANSATGVTTFPSLKLYSTDADSNSLQYRIFLALNSAFTGTTQTFDLSASAVGWSGINVGTSAYSSGTTAVYVIGAGLSNSTVYHWKGQALDPNGANTWTSLSAGSSFTTVAAANQNPNTPTNSSPSNGTGGVSLTPTLTASAFSDPDGGDTQAASQWQVATDSGFTSIVFDTGTTGAASNTVNVTTTLSVGTTYYWHARYQDNNGAWSSYSSYTNFTTNKVPNTPTNTTPGAGTTAVSFTPTLTASSFSDPDAGDTQSASQFQVATDSGFTSVVWDTGTTGPASNSTSVTTTLNVGTTYYWHVRYKDNLNNWSSYSTGTFFVTNRAPNTPTLTSPANSATGVTTFPTLANYATDLDGNPLQYRIFLALNSAFTGTTQTFDQTVSNVGWSGQNVGTSAYSSGSTAAYVIGAGLSNSTTYYWKSQAKDYSGSDTWSNLSIGFSFTTVAAANQNPNTPTNSSPSNGTGGVSLTPTLTASAFSDPDGGDTQAASQWQVATDSGFTSIVFDTGTTGAASNTVNVTTTLSVGTTYYWHARYQDNNGAWSSYSSYTNFTTNKVPNTPTLTTPANGATGVTTSPTLSNYTTDPDGNPLKYRIFLATNAAFTGTTQTFDQTVSNVGWSGQNVGTSAYSSGSTAAYIIQTVLNYSTVYHWKSQAIDYSGTNQWSSLSTGSSFTTVAEPNQNPNTPTNSTPSNGTGGVSLTPTLSASAFSDPNGGDTQAASQWQVATDTGFTSIVFDTGTTGAASNSVSVTTTLSVGTTYYWRVRYQDNNSAWSSYSSYTNFTTNKLPNTPTNSTPATGTTAVSTNPTLTSSAFSDPDGSDTHANSQWQIDTNGTFSGTVVWDSSTTATNKTSVVVNTTNGTFQGALSGQTALAYTTQYYFRVRHQDNAGNWSSYSTATNFTTGGAPSPTPTSTRKVSDFHWKFDEGYGTTTYNKSTYTATLSGTTLPAWTLSGKIGKALSFNGTSSKLDVNTTTGLDFGSSAFTVSSWVYPTSTTGVRSIFSTSKYIFYIEDGQLKLQKSSAGFETIASGTTLTPNQWSYVSFTRSGTGADQSALYINGTEVARGTIPDFGTGIANSNIGYETANGRYFSGIIDELKVYPSSLLRNEVLVDRNADSKMVAGVFTSYSSQYCVPGSSDSCAAPVAEWKFDEGVGTTARDSSGTGNNAVFAAGSSAPTWTSGKIGKGLRFDGSKTYLFAPALTGIKTISFWVKPTTTTQRVIDFDNGTHYISATSGIISANGFTSPFIYVNGVGTSLVSAGIWQHITITTSTGFNGTAVTIGKSTTNFFTGQLDHILVYDYARTPSQVAYDYNKGGPVGWWKLDECTSTIARDWSGIGNTGSIIIGASGTQTSAGTCSTAGTAWGVGSTGKFNSSINLDGSDDYIKTSVLSGRTFPAISISAWVNSNTFTESSINRGIVADEYGSGDTNVEFSIHLVGASHLLTTGFYDTTWHSVGSTSTFPTNRWVHVVGTYDGHFIKLYQDGQLVTTSSDLNLALPKGTTGYRIGRRWDTGAAGDMWKGKIDDARIYNYPLTPSQIKQIYTGGSVNFR